MTACAKPAASPHPWWGLTQPAAPSFTLFDGLGRLIGRTPLLFGWQRLPTATAAPKSTLSRRWRPLRRPWARMAGSRRTSSRNPPHPVPPKPSTSPRCCQPWPPSQTPAPPSITILGSAWDTPRIVRQAAQSMAGKCGRSGPARAENTTPAKPNSPGSALHRHAQANHRPGSWAPAPYIIWPPRPGGHRRSDISNTTRSQEPREAAKVAPPLSPGAGTMRAPNSSRAAMACRSTPAPWRR